MLGRKTQVTGQLGSQPRPAAEPFLKSGPIQNWRPLLKAACPDEELIPAQIQGETHQALYIILSGEQGKVQQQASHFSRNIPKCLDHWILETHQDGKALNFLRVYFPSYSIHVSCQGIRGVCYFLTTKSHWYNFLTMECQNDQRRSKLWTDLALGLSAWDGIHIPNTLESTICHNMARSRFGFANLAHKRQCVKSGILDECFHC